jgi:hypothetical protein
MLEGGDEQCVAVVDGEVYFSGHELHNVRPPVEVVIAVGLASQGRDSVESIAEALTRKGRRGRATIQESAVYEEASAMVRHGRADVRWDDESGWAPK